MCRPGVSDRALTQVEPSRDVMGTGSLATVGYREFPPPTTLRGLVECAWVVDGPPEPVRVLPDGCMDLMRLDGPIVVAGPDTTASVSPRDGEPFVGLRFRPGVLPRLLGVPASELRNERVPLSAICRPAPPQRRLVDRSGRRACVRRTDGPKPRHGRCRC